jgi:AAA family ATP:ADP antiporter
MSETLTQPEFSKLRSAIWPVHAKEFKKFFPMAIIMLLILFNYTVVRSLKDALVIATQGSGAEVVNFLKSWVVLPVSILFVLAFAKLSNMLSRQALYYTCLLPFVVFFGAFAFLIYPNKDFLHPDPQTIEVLKTTYPYFQWVFPIYGLWTYSAFYVLAELWGNIGINILFWQFANQITPTAEAKRFYPLIAVIGNIALILAGSALKSCTQVPEGALEGVDNFGVALNYLMSFVVASGLGIAAIYYWMNKFVLTDSRYYVDAAQLKKGKESKPKLSIGESIKYLFSSKYLGYIALLVLGYGMTINLIEVTWKAQVKMAYPDSMSYAGFMGDLYFYVGILTIGILFATKGVVQRFGWATGAMATPIMILITGALFFAFVLWRDSLGGIIAILGTTPLMAAVYVGAIQNALGKGTKYALFDPTREMAYIPLDQEMKIKGKAAVDVIGGRMGKSGGGWIQLLLLSIMGSAGTQIAIAPYLAGAMILIVFAWIWAVKGLSREYEALVIKKDGHL